MCFFVKPLLEVIPSISSSLIYRSWPKHTYLNKLVNMCTDLLANLKIPVKQAAYLIMSQNQESATTSWSNDNSNKFGVNSTVRRLHGILRYSEPLVAAIFLCCCSKNMPKLRWSYKRHTCFNKELFINILVRFFCLLFEFWNEKPGKYSQTAHLPGAEVVF